MKKFLIGLTTGIITGLTISCLYHRKTDKHDILDDLGDEINKIVAKGRKRMKNMADQGRNEAEYIKERMDSKMHKGDVEVE